MTGPVKRRASLPVIAGASADGAARAWSTFKTLERAVLEPKLPPFHSLKNSAASGCSWCNASAARGHGVCEAESPVRVVVRCLSGPMRKSVHVQDAVRAAVDLQLPPSR